MKTQKESIAGTTAKLLVEAASDAAKKIAEQAQQATVAISSAARDATQLLALNAAEATKVLHEKTAADHDLLIELRTRMEGLKVDIKEMRDGHAGKIDDHEARIKKLCEWRVGVDGSEGASERLSSLETGRSKQDLWMKGVVAILGVLVGLLVFHILKIGV